MKRITVFCGSAFGNKEIYKTQATLLGKTLAQQDIELVYGGADLGLMGTIANGVLDEGGKVIGVLPHFMKSREIAHENLTELILVKSMHERKAKMNELSDGFITIPGGIGTLEEFFEILTWGQLGLHNKPIAVLNVDNFYDSLVELIASLVEKGFLRQVNLDMIIVSDNIEDLLEKMKNYKAPPAKKVISEDTI
jgi:hypothetical protein